MGARTRWVVAAAVVAALVAVPVGTVTRPAAPPEHVALPPFGAGAPVAPPTAPPCRAPDMLLERGTDLGSAMNVYLLNTGTAPCSLVDTPALRAFTPRGERVSILRWSSSGSRRNIEPGRQASFPFSFTPAARCARPVHVDRVVLSLDGGDVVVARPGRVCNLAVGEYQSSDFAASDASRVPWSGSVDAVTGARAGTTVTFRARLANRSGTEGVVLRCIDEYEVRLRGPEAPAIQRRTLPCAPGATRAGVVPPGETATVTFKVYVPHRFAGRRLTVRWTFLGVSALSTMDVERAATPRG